MTIIWFVRLSAPRWNWTAIRFKRLALAPRALRDQEVQPHCVSTDLLMPGIMGVLLARQVRLAADEKTVLIVMTGSPDKIRQALAGGAGADHVLLKGGFKSQAQQVGVSELTDGVDEPWRASFPPSVH